MLLEATLSTAPNAHLPLPEVQIYKETVADYMLGDHTVGNVTVDILNGVEHM